MREGMGFESGVFNDVVRGDSFFIDSGPFGFHESRLVRDAHFPAERYAEFRAGRGVFNHSLVSIPGGSYMVRQMCRTMQAHELQWKVPAQVPDLTHFQSEQSNVPPMVVIHPCCPPATEAWVDCSFFQIRKGMANGRIAFLDRRGTPLLRLEPYGTDHSRVWIQRMTDNLILFEWAVLAAIALVPDPTAPDGPIVAEFDPSDKAKAPPVYWRSL